MCGLRCNVNVTSCNWIFSNQYTYKVRIYNVRHTNGEHTFRLKIEQSVQRSSTSKLGRGPATPKRRRPSSFILYYFLYVSPVALRVSCMSRAGISCLGKISTSLRRKKNYTRTYSASFNPPLSHLALRSPYLHPIYILFWCCDGDGAQFTWARAHSIKHYCVSIAC